MKKGIPHLLLKMFLAGVVFASAALILLSFTQRTSLNVRSSPLRPLDGLLDHASELFAILAVSLIGWRLLGSSLRKAQPVLAKTLQRVWLFFRSRHMLFGWIVAAAATGHGVYFLLQWPRHQSAQYSGLIAYAAMGAVIGVGVYFQYRGRSSRKVRIVHTALGILFVAAMLVHA